MNPRVVTRTIAIAVLAATFAQTPVRALTARQTGRTTVAATAMRVSVKLLVEKMDKDKVTTSIPFELVVRPGRETTLNHGRQVAAPMMTDKNGVTSYHYMSIGSNVMISDMNIADNVITFNLLMDISAVDPTPNPAVPISQSFRKYSLSGPVTVINGQASVITMSTDQTSAETVRLTVTATVLH